MKNAMYRILKIIFYPQNYEKGLIMKWTDYLSLFGFNFIMENFESYHAILPFSAKGFLYFSS